MPAIEQREIANLLGEAGAAHGVYEEQELKGVYDQGWPAWYAAYLVEHGIGDLLGKAITTEQLARLLKQYDEDYRSQQRQEGWPDYYAAQLLKHRDQQTGVAIMNMKLEVLVLPVSDVDRAKLFYEALGFRMDIDYVASEDFRVVQLTPPGSECSIIIGNGITSAQAGSVQGLHLVVVDIEAARAELVGRGVDVGEVFHDAGGVFHHIGDKGRVAGLAPEHKDYGSFASFSDPDGNGWVLQEIKQRAPGR